MRWRVLRRPSRPAVVVDRNFKLFAQRPDGLVDRVIQLWQMGAGSDTGQKDTTHETGIFDPADLGQGVVDIIQHQLRHTGVAAGRGRADLL